MKTIGTAARREGSRTTEGRVGRFPEDHGMGARHAPRLQDWKSSREAPCEPIREIDEAPSLA